MNTRNVLIGATSIILIWMIALVIKTSMESNLFEEFPELIKIPWMATTLWDFYANVFFIYLWVFYKETSWTGKLLWLILFVGLGSIATALYLLIQLVRLKPEEPIVSLFVKRK